MNAKPTHRTDDDLDAVWRALSSPLRRRILDLLLEGPLTTGELSDHFPDLSRFAVMQHMKVLEQAGLVLVRREGRRRFNYMNPVPIQEIHDRWVTRYTRPWAEGLVDLRDELEGRPRAKRRTPKAKR
jgi:DNA-binding transcriptional ArsR family regulator